MDPLHDLTLGDVVREHGRSRPLRTALVCGAYRGTYPELNARTDRLANALLAAGLGEGDTVLWLGQNCHRLIETLVACAKAGGVLVPANWRQSADELVTVLDDVAPAVVIWQSEEIGATVQAARGRWVGTARWLRHDADTAGPRAADPGEETYEAFLSSRATGRPRVCRGPGRTGARLVHRRLRGAAQRRPALARRGAVPGIDGRAGAAHHRGHRLPELRTHVPHGDAHDDVRHARHGRHQRHDVPGRRGGAVPARRGRAVQLRLLHGSDVRRDPRAQQGRALRPLVPAHVRRQCGLERHGPGRRQPLGHPSGRLRPDGGHRHAHLQRPGHRRDRHERPPVAVGAGAHRRPRGQRRARRRDRRDRGPGPGADQRLPPAARAQRGAHPRRLVAHQRPRPTRG